MIRISRDWATPLTIGVFGLMAVTGLLMFFHLDSPVQKTVHEWAGWVVVAAAVAHVTSNWLGFKRYFKSRGLAPVLLGVSAVVLAGTFALRPGADADPPPPAIAIRALSQAPLKTVAAVFGKSPAQALQELAAAGIVLADDEASIASAVGTERQQIGRALVVLSRRNGR